MPRSTDTMTGVSCPHCHAALSPTELTDGWCESCGKRLPPFVLEQAIVWVLWARRQDRLRKQRALAGWVMTGGLLGLAGLIASRLLFDLPPVHEPGRSVAPWLLGAPVGGGTVLGVLFLLLGKSHPRVVRAGISLAALGQLLITCAVLVMWFVAHLAR